MSVHGECMIYVYYVLCVFIYLNGLMWLWHSISSGSFGGYFTLYKLVMWLCFPTIEYSNGIDKSLCSILNEFKFESFFGKSSNST